MEKDRREKPLAVPAAIARHNHLDFQMASLFSCISDDGKKEVVDSLKDRLMEKCRDGTGSVLTGAQNVKK